MAKTPPHPSDRKRRLKRWALGCYRLGVILAALVCLRALPREADALEPELVLAEARHAIPSAASVGDPSDGLFPLLDAEGQTVGFAASTFPQAENIQGYSGASELLVVFDSDRKVKAVRFLSSADTDGHVKIVRDDPAFWRQWDGKPESTLGSHGQPLIVSGATLTSEAMARGLAARFGAEGMDQWFPAPLKLADLAKWFPQADLLEEDEGAYRIGKGGETLGTVLRSSRMGISARGYNGTSDVIVCLDAAGAKVLGVGFLGSRDNEPYISDVRNEVKYADGFAGKTPQEIIAEDIRDSPSLFTSGASYTNQAFVESVREMLRRHLADVDARGFPWKISLALAWIAAGAFLGLHRFGNKSAVRYGFAAVSVVAGIALGWMVSQDQLLGWGANGFGVRGILPLLALTAVALVVPAFTGKNVYCNRICPHGAAQTLLGRVVRKRFSLPPKFHLIMTRVPWLTLLVIWVLAFMASGLPFAYFEPFETWSSGIVAFVPATIFTVGLIAAFFLPQAYCHYGCPTGALLKFLTASPTAWTRRDTFAAVLVAAACLRIVL
jgi:NosR/NirI family transcriptional regulator, nitrous oxide reductase regulator